MVATTRGRLAASSAWWRLLAAGSFLALPSLLPSLPPLYSASADSSPSVIPATTPLFQISADFPGGNILVDGIEADVIRLRQDRRNATEWWFYWCFRIRGAEGRTLRFVFGDDNVFTAAGPCYSRDGETWRWLGPTCVAGEAFTHAFAPDENEAWFALTTPYTERNLQHFLTAHSALLVRELAKSEQGRRIELLTLPAPRPEGAVLLTARMHACEAQASYVLEGFMDYWLSDPVDGRQLREQFDLFVVPMVDKDGVERGDQGKLRAPHDHNRDFSTSPRYAATAALMHLIEAEPRRWRVVFDLHCPWIRNPDNEKIFFVERPEPHLAAQRRFAATLEAMRRGPLPFLARDSIPFGTAWNQGHGFTFLRFVQEKTPCPLSATIEIPYARAHEAIVTPDAAREFGRDLARAVACELRGKSS